MEKERGLYFYIKSKILFTHVTVCSVCKFDNTIIKQKFLLFYNTMKVTVTQMDIRSIILL